MEFSIEDFLPKYPNIDPVFGLDKTVLDPYSGKITFQAAIHNKQEFRELTLGRTEQRPEPGKPYKHQSAIARFLSSHTIYNSLLLDHEMGTGKSCSAFSAIESIRSTSNNFKGALVLTRGPRILDNLIKELVYVCTSGKYIPSEVERKLTENERKRRLTKLVSDFYTFDTFEKFAKGIAPLSDARLAEKYSNLIIVIDEVHNLRLHGEESRNYKSIHRLLHSVKNSKIIIMSGTPMKDDPSEISDILNLILPMSKQLPSGNDFKKHYLVQHGSNLSTRYTIKPHMVEPFKDNIRGYVSYLKAMTSDTKVQYMGGTVEPGLKHFKVIQHEMSPFQTDAYKTAYKMDTAGKTVYDIIDSREESGSTSGIYSNARQASLFVFPDGSYGKAGFDKFFTKEARNQIFHYKPTPALISALRAPTEMETLRNIYKFSSTYGAIIESILKNPDKLHFIYDSFVHGSGSIVLGKLLGLFGFNMASGNEVSNGKRYAILTNSTASQKSVSDIIKKFNSKENRLGNIIRVIIGSKILAEGITLKNVREIHIATPHWNYSELAQAIARGIRLESHRALIEAGIDPVVRVYQHVAMPAKSADVPSIDLEMYTLCESKDISIKAVERLLKEAAVDCSIFYARNIGMADGSRDCDYQKCNYKCDGIEGQSETIDMSTYNLYYKTKTDVVNAITQLFRNHDTMNFLTIKTVLQRPHYVFEKGTYEIYSEFDIVSELKNIITSNIPVKNRLGINCYLREKSDVYFLVDTISAGDDFLSSEYARRPVVTNYETFDDASANVLINSIERGENVEYCFNRLSIKHKCEIIQTFIENFIDTPHLLEKQTPLVRFIQRKGFIKNQDEYAIGDSEFFRNTEGVWKQKPPKQPTIKPGKTEAVFRDALGKLPLRPYDERSQPPPYPYIGLWNPENGAICIKELKKLGPGADVRKESTGRRLQSIPSDWLSVICAKMKLKVGDTTKQFDFDTLYEAHKNKIDEIEFTEEEKPIFAYFMGNFDSRDINKPMVEKLIVEKLINDGQFYSSAQCGIKGAIKKKAVATGEDEDVD